jgi:hypothetical protein
MRAALGVFRADRDRSVNLAQMTDVRAGRALFRSVVGCDDGVASEVTGNLRRVAQKCAQRPAVTLRVRTMDDHPFATKRH